MDLAALGVEVAPADTPDIDTSIEDTSTDEATGNGDEAGDQSAAENSDQADVDADATDKPEPTPNDGRTIPKHLREVFKEHKELRAMYFQAQEFRKHFETPAKAAETLDQLAALGGFDGINATQAEFAEIDRMFESGDKAVLDKFLAKPANKEGFAKLAPALFDEFRKADESGWTHEVAKVMASTLSQAGVSQDLSLLSAMLKDNPEASALLKKISSIVGGIDRLAAEAPKPKVDPEREKFLREKADFEKSKSELFMQEVNAGIGQHIERGIKDSLEPYLKGRKLDKESYSIIEANVGGELTKLMNADPTFAQQRDAVLKSGDKARITKFFTARITKHLPDATKRVMRAFGSANGTTPTTATATAKGTPTSNGVMRLSKPPSPSEIDYKRSGDMIMDSKAYLRSGKLVTWAD